MKEKPADEALPRVCLNHFYVVLDTLTYTAIDKSEFLRKHFAPNEARTTVRTDQTYTGLYFYGVNTYFEFFDIANSPRPRVGDSGIAFGVDQPGGIAALLRRPGVELEPNPEAITRLYKNEQVPWFLMARSKRLQYESGMSSWIMEYHPEFLQRWHPQAQGANEGIRRENILTRYSEAVEPVRKPWLGDVTGLTIAVDEVTRTNTIQFCQQLGYRLEKQDDAAVSLQGPDVSLLLIPATKSIRGIREIRMQARNLPESKAELQLGKYTLEFLGDAMIWKFR